MRIRKTLWSNDAEPIIVIMIILLVLGTINVFSSSFVLSTIDYETPYHFLIRHTIWLVVGLIAFVICRRINYRRWRNWMPMLLMVMLLSLAAVLVVGNSVNGAKRWLGVGAIAFQPAEFAKLLSLMLAAAVLASQIKRGKEISVVNLQYGIIAVMAGLTELEPDLGTAAIICGVPLIMAVVAGMNVMKIVRLGAVVLAGVVGLIFLQPYRLNRIRIMLDPWSDAQGIGYQTVQSLSTIGSGGFWGMGLGDGVSKYEYLPEAHTDFAFAIFCQEHGYVGALMVFLLFALMIFFCVRIANRAEDEFGQILATGIMLLILGQALANMAMVGGMFAVVGVPLPFISYGGSSLLVTMIAMGILLNICDHGHKPQPKFASKQSNSDEEKQDRDERPSLHLVK